MGNNNNYNHRITMRKMLRVRSFKYRTNNQIK